MIDVKQSKRTCKAFVQLSVSKTSAKMGFLLLQMSKSKRSFIF